MEGIVWNMNKKECVPLVRVGLRIILQSVLTLGVLAGDPHAKIAKSTSKSAVIEGGGTN